MEPDPVINRVSNISILNCLTAQVQRLSTEPEMVKSLAKELLQLEAELQVKDTLVAPLKYSNARLCPE